MNNGFQQMWAEIKNLWNHAQILIIVKDLLTRAATMKRATLGPAMRRNLGLKSLRTFHPLKYL